jgi:hypothetical protein
MPEGGQRSQGKERPGKVKEIEEVGMEEHRIWVKGEKEGEKKNLGSQLT